MNHEILVPQLAQKIHDVLSQVMRQRSTAALLDFPSHPNVGDSLIWCGQKTVLKRLGVSLPYVCDISTFCQEEMSIRLMNGVILLSGGSNLGDLWPKHQYFREKILTAFPHHPIIQLPQSICFQSRENLKRAQKVFNRHPDFTLFVRDKQSYELARNEFRVPVYLCPDMAFALGRVDRFDKPTEKIFWLRRMDQESRGYFKAHPKAGIHEADWIDEDPTLAFEMNQFLTERMRSSAHNIKKDFHLISRTYDRLAQERFLRGTKILSRAKVIMTDRLHGHILSLMMGIPHVCLDNNYGKIKSFYQTWTKDCDLAQWADSAEEALEIAQSLLKVQTEMEESAYDQRDCLYLQSF